MNLIGLLAFGGGKKMKKYKKIVESVFSSEVHQDVEKLTAAELREMTSSLKNDAAAGGMSDSVKIKALAVISEAVHRTLGITPYRVQLIGGMAMYDGAIAEMMTGEGKTIVALISSYLRVLSGFDVHVVTSNEYLARRDSVQARRVFGKLGVTVGLIENGMPASARRDSYACNIVYGTASEFGFDYLRDNMAMRTADVVRKSFEDTRYCAIIDEADSILIDEAKTPLIISSEDNDDLDLYRRFAEITAGLQDKDVELDLAEKTIAPTDETIDLIEKVLGCENLYDDVNLVNHLQQALRARFLFTRDVDYTVRNGEVVIVDPFTGRIMDGRRWSNGLHQAVEAKEGVLVKKGSKTLATVTIQNYFKLYDKLSGMTGTAMSDEKELHDVYNLEVVRIPTNRPIARKDEPDLMFGSKHAKNQRLIADIIEYHNTGRPCLVGTTSIADSERISEMLSEEKIPHAVLNAKHHEQEARIIAQAGRKGAVTIATNMAGRGTDILLGGNADGLLQDRVEEEIARLENEAGGGWTVSLNQAYVNDLKSELEDICASERQEVIGLGGLVVMGTEHHNSRRIDNQLRGRSGRQGEPGLTRFYVSLEDDIFARFGDEKVKKLLLDMGKGDDSQLDDKTAKKLVYNVQCRVEGVDASVRKSLFDYDEILNGQRLAMYAERRKLLSKKSNVLDTLKQVAVDFSDKVCSEYCSFGTVMDDWNFTGLEKRIFQITGRPLIVDWTAVDEEEAYQIVEDFFTDSVRDCAESAEEDILMQRLLISMDLGWRRHLSDMDELRSGIGLRAHAGRDPLVEYKEEAFSSFSAMIEDMYFEWFSGVCHAFLKGDMISN